MSRSVLDNPATIERFYDGLRLGLTEKDAANRAGISAAVIDKWKAEGRTARQRGGKLTQRERQAIELVQNIESTVSDMKAQLHAVILRAAPTTWQAAAWLLERRWPAEYSRLRVEHTGPDGGPIPVDVQVSVRQQLTRRIDDMAERLVPAPPAELPAGPGGGHQNGANGHSNGANGNGHTA